MSAVDEAGGSEEAEHEIVCEEVQEEDPGAAPSYPHVHISDVVRSAFLEHCEHLRDARRKRRQALQIQAVVPQLAPAPDEPSASQPGAADAAPAASNSLAEASAAPGERLDSDLYEGDCVLRTLNQLLAMVDDRGYARSPQQCQFHDAFIRACSRVMYRKNWNMSKPDIMKQNSWADCPSQILVSTPRRFGKTFSYVTHIPVVTSPAKPLTRHLAWRVSSQHRNLRGRAVAVVWT